MYKRSIVAKKGDQGGMPGGKTPNLEGVFFDRRSMGFSLSSRGLKKDSWGQGPEGEKTDLSGTSQKEASLVAGFLDWEVRAQPSGSREKGGILRGFEKL